MTRLISAFVLGFISLLAVIYAPSAVFLAGIGIIGTACLYEYFGLVRSMKFEAQPWLGYIALWAMLLAFRYSKLPPTVLTALVMTVLFLAAMWRRRSPIRERATGLMAELLGIFYCVFFLYPAIAIRFDFGDKTGLHWIIVLLGIVWAGDTAALVFGKLLGKTPFSPLLSPKKTYEGAIAGLLAGIGVAAALQHFLFVDLPLQHVMAAAALTGVIGQLGDLAESMLKRAAVIKDSSHLIPGHGGVLDRMDSLLFAFPVLYFYLLLLYT